jgi:hypothetical protein
MSKKKKEASAKKNTKPNKSLDEAKQRQQTTTRSIQVS